MTPVIHDRLSRHGVELVHSEGSLTTVRWREFQLDLLAISDRHIGMIDLRASNGDGSLLTREVFSQTGQGIDSMAERLARQLHLPNKRLVVEVISCLVFGMLPQTAVSQIRPLLGERDDAQAEVFRAEPIVLADEVSILLGPTGQTKTIQLAAIAVAVASGVSVGPHCVTSDPSPVLILDGETTRIRLAEVVDAIGRGHGIDRHLIKQQIHYGRIEGPIAQNIDEYRRWVANEGIEFVGVDSVDTARGGDAISTTGPLFDALRYLGTSVLATDHIPLEKVKKGIQDWRSAGSVWAQNRARQTWAIKVTQGTGAGKGRVRARFRLNATNRGLPGQTFEIPMSFSMHKKRYQSIRLGGPTELSRTVPTLQERAALALALLEKQGVLDPKPRNVAELMDEPPDSVRSHIQNLRQKDWATQAGTPLKLTPDGWLHLMSTWGDDLPSPKLEP